MSLLVSSAAVTASSAVTTPAASLPSESRLASLWTARSALVQRRNARRREYHRAWDSVPAWARSGPSFMNDKGERCGSVVGWPEVAVLPERPPGGELRCIRINPYELRNAFSLSVAALPEGSPEREGNRASYRAAMRALLPRIREARAERRRCGVARLEQELDAMNDEQWELEQTILALDRPSINQSVAILLIGASREIGLGNSVAEPQDSEFHHAVMVLRGLQGFASGPLRDTVDLMFGNPTETMQGLDIFSG
jgi:hypothetical protein